MDCLGNANWSLNRTSDNHHDCQAYRTDSVTWHSRLSRALPPNPARVAIKIFRSFLRTHYARIRYNWRRILVGIQLTKPSEQ